MQKIPIEIIGEILRRIPVKPLKRLRCVSKQWRALIDSQHFVKEHLRHSLITNSNRRLILVGLGLYTVDMDALERAQLLKPFDNRSVSGISNSCNGLILILVIGEGPVLFNVFTSEFRVLPPCPSKSLDSDYYSKTHYGLAYDEIADDYKVVKVVEFWVTASRLWRWSEVFIYGLKSNTWKKIEVPYPLLFVRGHWRAYANGVLHTLVNSYASFMAAGGGVPVGLDYIKIMAFDVRNEKHSCVELPLGIVAMDFHMSLDMIGGCLSLVCSRRTQLVIWVMKEYGVRESWVKLAVIGPPSIEKHDFLKPLAYSADGGMVLLYCNDKSFVWYDLKKHVVVANVNVEGIQCMFHAEACVQSLVSLGGEAEVKKPNQENKEKLKNKRDDFVLRDSSLCSDENEPKKTI